MAHKTPERFNKVLVLVEGIDDIPVYEVFFKRNVIDIQDCHGCEVLEKVHLIIEKETKWKKYLSIRDSDFLVLSNSRRYTEENFFYTDAHDSEMMMFKSPTLIKSVMRLMVGENGADIKKRICFELFYLSMLKWFIMFRSLKFKFEGLDLAHLSWNSQITSTEAIRFLEPTSRSFKLFPIKAYIEFQSKHPNPDVNHLINGHDFITRWAAIIKTEYHHQYSDSDFRKIICQCYTIKMAMSTTLYKCIKEWERVNALSVLNE